MSSATPRAPGLYGVIGIKLLKGSLLLLAALGMYSLLNNNLPDDFRSLLIELNVDPEKEFWARIAHRIALITPDNLVWVASGTVLYAGISLLEAGGLMFRQGWAAWLAIAEGAFFIPIEVFELSHKFTLGLSLVMVVNVLVVAYLYRNRDRLFHHGH